MSTFVYTNLDPATEARYSDLWSWYLQSLEAGAFENIAQDTPHRRALDQFVSQYATSYNSNILVLIMPTDDISRSPSLLTSLLSRYYGLDGTSTPRTVIITPIGSIHSSQSVIMVREQQARSQSPRSLQQSVEVDSVFSDEAGFVPSVDLVNQSSGPSSSDLDDSSIDSCSLHSTLSGASLTRVSTVQDGMDVIPSSTEPVIRVRTNSLSCDDGEVESRRASELSRESSGYSLQPFPTMVSAESTLNHRLVLRSILLRNLSTNETKTAIRQIEQNGMGDDWMLYDDMFSMSNLQLLTLDEVAESSALCCKFLFYALIADESHSQVDTDEEELTEHDLTVVEFDGGLQNSSYPIRFVQSNTTQATTPIMLSKTNTLRTNHESIRSEMLIHRPDSTYSTIQKSKSTPTSSSIKKAKKKKIRHPHNEKCVMM